MSTPLLQLGLDHDADERSVKRAYARRLREVRPDVDPVGFQRLNELYQHALEWVRQRDAAASAEPIVAYRISAVRFDGAAADSADSIEATPVEATPAPASYAPPDVPAVQVTWTPAQASGAGLSDPPRPIEIRWDAGSEREAARTTPSEDLAAARIALDFGAFFRSLAHQAALGDENALRDWLHGQPPLWSLTVKAEAARALMPALYEAAPPMPDRCLDAILAFFDLDHVLSGQNALQLGLLRRRLHVEWLLRQQDRRELDLELRNAQPAVNLDAARLIGLMSGPFRWLDVLWKARAPHRPTEAANFLAWLDKAKVESLPPSFDRRRIAFWRRAGDRTRVSWPRIAVTAARLTLILLLCALFDGLALAAGEPPFTTLLLAYAAIACAGYYTWLGLVQWQGAAQTDDVPGLAAWWRLGFIPLLAIATVVLRWLVPLDLRSAAGQDAVTASIGLAGIAVVLAFVRYRHRCGATTFGWLARFGSWRVYVFFLLLNLLALAVIRVATHAEIGAAVALGFWLLDLWCQRSYLRASLLGAPGR